MKLDLYDIDEFIKANHCLPVTNPVSLYADGTPTEDGLYSEIIFGSTTEAQMNMIGYIDLSGHHFIHPAIYSIIRGRMKKFDDIITGVKNGKVVNNRLVVVDDNDPEGNSGLDWFYDVFDKINWIDEMEYLEIDSIDKKNRLKLFRDLPKNIFFVDKWLVLPRGYRDYNTNDNSEGDEINKVYKKLIQLSKSLKSTFGFDLADNNVKYEIQKHLCILYDITLKLITGKNVDINTGEKIGGNAKFAMFRKHLIGAHVDFGASSVITAPNVSAAEYYDEAPAPCGYACVPLQSLISMLLPFFIHECTTILENISQYVSNILPGFTLVENQFSSSNIQKLLKRFIKSGEDRNEHVDIKLVSFDGTEKIYNVSIYETDVLTGNVRERNLTLMDIIYQAAKEVTTNKKILITRYPVTMNQNISIFRINVASTTKTHHVRLSFSKDEGDDYIFEDKKYPYIPADPNNYDVNKIWCSLVKVLICGNSSLNGFNGDYDGDVLHCRCLFSNEANAEAEKILTTKATYFDGNGKLVRAITAIGKDLIPSLYELTKNG